MKLLKFGNIITSALFGIKSGGKFFWSCESVNIYFVGNLFVDPMEW